jgi:hypothetical protein
VKQEGFIKMGNYKENGFLDVKGNNCCCSIIKGEKVGKWFLE